MCKFSFFSDEEPIDNNPYSGFKGLNIGASNFEDQVMSHDAIIALFANEKKYTTPYVYPPSVAVAFDKPVIFTAQKTEHGIHLTGNITSLTNPSGISEYLAYWMLPEKFTANDDIVFINKPGFGPGSIEITSVGSYNSNGEEVLGYLGVKNRPGLFFKITTSIGVDPYYEDMAIFFPAQINDVSHWPVRHGEAFVLVREGVDLDNDRIIDINNSFNRLVKKSYGDDEGLVTVETNEPIATDITLNHQTIY